MRVDLKNLNIWLDSAYVGVHAGRLGRRKSLFDLPLIASGSQRKYVARREGVVVGERPIDFEDPESTFILPWLGDSFPPPSKNTYFSMTLQVGDSIGDLFYDNPINAKHGAMFKWTA